MAGTDHSVPTHDHGPMSIEIYAVGRKSRGHRGILARQSRNQNRNRHFTTKCFISLRSPTEHENGKLRHAGMDGRHPGSQDASEDIHALHAGMTETRSRTKTDRGPPPLVFSKEITKATKDGNCYLSISSFVLFASFVVQCLFRFWLRLCRAGSFVVNQTYRARMAA
jgi:hypothetical protein